MREIGSEFWNVPISTEEKGSFTESTQWYLSGRSALQAIIAELKECHTAALPAWCCDSMIKPFEDAGIEVLFYPVWTDGRIGQQPRTDCEILFLMDYFGYTQPEPETADYRGIIIRDETHSVFSRSYHDADYYFGSMRKWCGVWTGGYARTKDGHKLLAGSDSGQQYVDLRKEAMEQKKAYIKGRSTEKEYLKVFAEAEEMLDGTGIVSAAERDVRLIRYIDMEQVKVQRRANAAILQAAFPEWLIFPEMNENDCPMFVPILVPEGKRDLLRKHLIAHSIYCPVHWPISKHHRLTEAERFLYDNELSLVCDQRYVSEDMIRIVNTIREFMGE